MNTQYKTFCSCSEADLWVEKYKSHFPSDNDSDKIFLKALDYYTASGNPIFNNHLRYHRPMEKNDYLYPYVTKMINKLPTYQIPDDIIVYRYINKGLLKEMCESYPPKHGFIMQDKGFMSTTLLRESVWQLRTNKKSNVLLVISIPKGTKGTYVGLLQDLLPEYEVILAPNTKLRIDYKIPFCNHYFECTVVN